MKSESRINPCYKKGTEDWKAELNMLLDDGVTCGDCIHSARCKAMFGGNNTNTYCQFYPSTFHQAEKVNLQGVGF